MADRMVALNISDQAQTDYNALEAQDRIYADALFDRLRNWHHDPTIRTESTILEAKDDVIAFRIDADATANFELAGDTIYVLSVEHNASREESREKAAEIAAVYEWARQQQFSVEEFEAGMRDIQENGGVEFDEIIGGIDAIFGGDQASMSNRVRSV